MQQMTFQKSLRQNRDYPCAFKIDSKRIGAVPHPDGAGLIDIVWRHRL